jgi:HEPN domain-containing protein
MVVYLDTSPVNAMSFIVYAESYGRAAYMLKSAIDGGGHLPFDVPIPTLALHCVELSLKSVLIEMGMNPDELKKKHGHSLKRLFRETAALNWSDIDVDAIEFYHNALLSQALRYRQKSVKDMYILMDNEQLFHLMETVFHRCLKYVSPTAKRSLRP